MRFGAHVSSSGGISKAIGRGVALGCESLQIFTHNPRTWRPIKHTDEEIAAFRAGAAEAGIGPIVSHGLYLINLGAPDRDVPTGPPGKPAVAMRNIYRASVESLVQHLTTGLALGLAGVVLHVGSFKGSAEGEAIERIGAGIAEAFETAEGDTCVYLENTAGAGDTIGRTFAQLRAVANAVGVPERLAFCLDSQHLYASGYPIHEEGGIDRVLADFDDVLGMDRLRCLHLNDSKVGFASNRDRHENIGDGEIGEEGLRRFLGHPDLQSLPVILEVPGMDGSGTDLENMARARRLHEDGLAARSG
ncbi:MAG TPA: deoxyribonuclease IV [Miltoncostaeaceae bacterium]|nr:deoxyribonuclease IV [Miltoncostaeaceae bacterium]